MAIYVDPDKKKSKSSTSLYDQKLKTRGSKKNQKEEEKQKRLDELSKTEDKKSEQKGKGFLESANDLGKGIGSFLFGGTAKLANTGLGIAEKAGIHAVGETKKLLGDKQGGEKFIQEQEKGVNERLLGEGKGLFGQGGLYKTLDELHNADTNDVRRRAYGTGLEAASEVLPIGAGLNVGRKVGKTGAKLIEGGIQGGLGAGVGSLGSQIVENGQVDTGKTLKDAAIGVGLGSAFAGAGAALSRGKSKIKSNSTSSVEAKQIAEDAAAREAAGVAPSAVISSTLTGVKNPEIGQAVKKVATPEGEDPTVPGTGESRYSSKTLQDSSFVADETKKNIGTSYQKVSNAQRGDHSLEQLDIEGVDNFSTKAMARLDEKHVTDQTVFDSQAAAQALEERAQTLTGPQAEADYQKAADIYDKLSTHLTKAGQTIQAASIMARRTPEGLRFQAQKQLKKSGVELTPKLQKELNELIEVVKTADKGTDGELIARDNLQYFIASKIPTSKADKLVNFWRAGLLTSPATTIGATTGNLAMLMQRKLVTNPVATLADWTMAHFTGKRTQTFGELGAFAKGGKEGTKNATGKQYWKTGLDPMSAKSKYDAPRQLNYGDGRIGKAVGGYVNGTYRLMGAVDQPFRYGAKSESLSSMAKAEAINQGLKGEAREKFVSDFMENPPQEFLERANQEGGYETFQNTTALGTVVSGAKEALKRSGMHKSAALVDFLIPFSQVPSAIASRLVAQTPIGTAREIVKQIAKVRKGEEFDQRAMSRAIGEGTMALPILAAGYSLAKNGDITGAYPSDPVERDRWVAEGKQPNSIRIGDRWYSMNYIQPFGTVLAMGGQLKDAETAGGSAGDMVAQAIAAGSKSFINQSFLQGLGSLADAVNNPTQYAGTYVANTAGSAIPNLVRAGARASDPVQRDIKGAAEGIQGGIPGLRQGLPEKVDAEGNTIPAKDDFVNQFANPFKTSVSRPSNDTEMYDKAVLPARRLWDMRKSEVNRLLSEGRVKAAQRKVDSFNHQMEKVITPYLRTYGDSLTEEQVDTINKLYKGKITINSKGRPTVPN